ncbi:hypothetical protein LY90DRAFT_270471 [Neocallimastix californiae]|uniref:Uncharacterized protein n=1 Tax=Neocallimastix californiae TaxID=1754190 RepID=A0A1Y2FGX8_9FUNG|nr:hypothetical protein LY90DRAFT_270471 [Neocallimastix californiae]|eukprot:ORY82867.1 hypothetical protein LY90DRAFT_270471 [Neocallimastix californiae]
MAMRYLLVNFLKHFYNLLMYYILYHLFTSDNIYILFIKKIIIIIFICFISIYLFIFLFIIIIIDLITNNLNC